MLRRLIVIEAAAYAKPNTRPLLHAPRKHMRKLRGFSADAPEAWRVSFRILDRRRPRRNAPVLAGEDAGGPRKRVSREDRWAIEAPVTFRSAWPLAERYAALIRVFNDPAPYARRLSRRLHATPHRIVEALRAPPEAGRRITRFGALARRARRAWRAHLSSA